MNFGFLKIPWFEAAAAHSYENTDSTALITSYSAVSEPPKSMPPFNMKFLDLSFLSFSKNKSHMPSTVNQALKKYAQSHTITPSGSVRFRPYVCKVPWHTGLRGILSQFFPRYGHYCGPNWSSGKDKGSLVWDKRPIDWLDYCCYCHDIGYDTYDQAELLKADLAFLECLERSNMHPKGNPHIAHLYKTMCISGLKNVLIPYRQNLLGFQTMSVPFNFRWPSSDWKLKRWDYLHKDLMSVTSSIFGSWLNNLNKWKRHNSNNNLQKL